jgi:hypothetical protein
LWLAETNQQPISQTTWLKVIPHCNHCNHYARGGHSAAGLMLEVDTVLFPYSSAIFTLLGSDHLCCFLCWLPIDQPYFALCLSMPSFLLFLREVLADWTVPSIAWFVLGRASWLL